jgi:hypothetical protein
VTKAKTILNGPNRNPPKHPTNLISIVIHLLAKANSFLALLTAFCVTMRLTNGL